MKRHKTLIPVLLILFFFVIFGASFFLWKTDWEHSSAESSTTLVENNSNRTLLTVDTTFYNYRYDREIYDGKRDQGAQSCYDGSVIPFGTFDNKLSKYYEDNKVKMGIYAGNFYMYYGGLEGVGNKKLEFPGYYNFRWAANIANRNIPYNSVCKGIVSDTLSGFSTTNANSGTLMTKTDSGQVSVPYFNKSFLSKEVNNVDIGAVKEHVGFPFRQITSGSKKGYYEFDSTKDVIRFKDMWNQTQDTPKDDRYYFGSEGKLQYYYNTSFVYSKASNSPQFLPYNKANSQFSSTEPGTSDRQKILDYGFGIRFNIPFYLSEDGTVDGKNMVFEFSGDDDVWIFLDGKLVLDLGGQHGKATGTIDFGGNNTTAKVTNKTVTYVNGSNDASSTITSDKILAEDTYVKSETTTINGIQKGDSPEKKHILTIFYMERGMFESNFHMAFNFVPEGVPVPTTTPSPTVEPTAEPTLVPGTTATPVPTQVPNHDDSLTIQNKMVFPTTTPDGSNQTESKINSAFLETVKDLAEDDIFQYSIQNKGTEASVVQDSGIKYPSGKLTVRENGSSTIGKKTSYLSFGAEPYIRIYLDIGDSNNPSAGSILKKIRDFGSKTVEGSTYNFTNFDFEYDTDNNIKNLHDGTVSQLKKVSGSSSLYYADLAIDKTNLNFNTNYITVKDSNQAIRIHATELTAENVGYTKFKDLDGKLFTVQTITYKNGGADISGWTEVTNHANQDLCKPLNMIEYSNGLPNQSIGTDEKIFSPADATVFNNVSDTSYEITEVYPAPTSAPDSTESKKILFNSNTTSGITNLDGEFGLFYDDSATFRKQFATGSQMKVVQKDTLLTPTRYPEESLSSSTDVQEALTTFCTPVVTRNTNDYYYTTVTAESKSADRTKTQSINVSYDGQYTYANAATIPTDDPVDITQTFTNTIKTGSLSISKELKGNMDADSNHSYGFQVSFSNVFGGNSGAKPYSGSYTLVKEDGSKTENTTTTGLIVLKPNQKAILSGIPVGTSYQIQEKATDGSSLTDGSVVSDIQTSYRAEIEDDSIFSPIYKESNTTAEITVTKSDRTISGVIPCKVVDASYGNEVNEFTEVHVSVAYTNQFGALSITKKIAGDVNNSAYYGTDANGIATKEYTFTIKEINNLAETSYNGAYRVYTYTYPNGPNMAPTVTQEDKTTTDGTITLKESQKAEIGGIPLDSSHTYTITETVEATDIFFVEALKVTAGTGQDTSSDNTQIKTTLSSTNPAFDVVYSNRYSNAYLTIEKFVDKVYYNGKEYSSGLTYQQLTNANQSFLFTIKQYKQQSDAQAGNDQYESSFEIILSMGDTDTEKDVTETFGTNTYSYKLSKTVKVLGNRYYRIEENTNWSWKYILQGIDILDENPNPKSEIIADSKIVILKSYLDVINELENKKIPTAKFYNTLDDSKKDIDGDTGNVVNKIKPATGSAASS